MENYGNVTTIPHVVYLKPNMFFMWDIVIVLVSLLQNIISIQGKSILLL